MRTYLKIALFVVVFSTLVMNLSAAGQEAPQMTRGTQAGRLVGIWQNKAGNRLVYRADGTGENPDASRFVWTLAGDLFTARALNAEGKAVGDPFKIPISFTKDGKEYTISIEGGKRDIVYFRLEADRRIAQQRTVEGRIYVTGPKAAPKLEVRKEDEFSPLPVYDDPQLLRKVAGSIEVEPNVHVSSSRGDVPHWEVILTADPGDPRRLFAGSMCNPPPINYGVPKIMTYVSFDRGKTWEPSLRRFGASTDVFADPTAAHGPDGSLYFANLYGPSLGSSQGWVEVSRSQDGGKSWSQPTGIAGWRDRPFIAVDRTTGPWRGRLYCITADGLYTSTDRGGSFGPLAPLSRRPGYVSTGTGNVVVLSNGRVVVLCNGYLAEAGRSQAPAGLVPAYLAVRVSRDGGSTFDEEKMIAEGSVAALPPSIALGPIASNFADDLYVIWNQNQDASVSRRDVRPIERRR